MMRKRELDRERRELARCRRGLCSLDPDIFGGGDAPQPDPAIGAAAAANARVAQQAFNFYRNQYRNSADERRELFDIGTRAADQALTIQEQQAQQARNYYNYQTNTYRPVERTLVRQATNFNTAARRNELAAQAGADVHRAAAQSKEVALRDAARYGINPNDAAFKSELATNSHNLALAKAGAMNNARTAARTEGRAFMFDAAALGRGLPSAGTTAASVALQAGNTAVSNYGAPLANARADAAMMGTGFNTSIAGNTAAGSLYNDLYRSQMMGYQAESQQDAATWQGIGQLAGAAGMAMMFMSSKKLKDKSGDVSDAKVVKEVKKMPIDRWKYKPEASADQETHIGPYAEDFAKRFGVGDGKRISVIDAVGVTLAAAKGIAKQVEKLERRVSSLARSGLAPA